MIGDWYCRKCSKLNYGFSRKCVDCGTPKPKKK